MRGWIEDEDARISIVRAKCRGLRQMNALLEEFAGRIYPNWQSRVRFTP